VTRILEASPLSMIDPLISVVSTDIHSWLEGLRLHSCKSSEDIVVEMPQHNDVTGEEHVSRVGCHCEESYQETVEDFSFPGFEHVECSD